jgi:hypothetical protein
VTISGVAVCLDCFKFPIALGNPRKTFTILSVPDLTATYRIGVSSLGCTYSGFIGNAVIRIYTGTEFAYPDCSGETYEDVEVAVAMFIVLSGTMNLYVIFVDPSNNTRYLYNAAPTLTSCVGTFTQTNANPECASNNFFYVGSGGTATITSGPGNPDSHPYCTQPDYGSLPSTYSLSFAAGMSPCDDDVGSTGPGSGTVTLTKSGNQYHSGDGAWIMYFQAGSESPGQWLIEFYDPVSGVMLVQFAATPGPPQPDNCEPAAGPLTVNFDQCGGTTGSLAA